jgi:hypothetical protein
VDEATLMAIGGGRTTHYGHGGGFGHPQGPVGVAEATLMLFFKKKKLIFYFTFSFEKIDNILLFILSGQMFSWWPLNSIEWLRFEENLMGNFGSIAGDPDPHAWSMRRTWWSTVRTCH